MVTGGDCSSLNECFGSIEIPGITEKSTLQLRMRLDICGSPFLMIRTFESVHWQRKMTNIFKVFQQ
jgi:hypothetical protein